MAAVRKAYAPISDDDENALFQEEPIQLTSNNKSTADADGHGNAHHLHPTRPYRLQSQRRKGARKSSWWGVILFTTSILIMATIFYRYSVSAATSAASSVGTTSEDQSVANTTDQTSFSADASPTTNIINSSSQTSNTSSSFIILDKYLKKLIIRRGDGLNFPKNGDQIGVYYIGIFASDEKEFDKSTTSVFETSIGVNRVIKGWDVGIPSMSLGEICNLYISSEWAYGARGYFPEIPPNADLIFQVELVKINTIIYTPSATSTTSTSSTTTTATTNTSAVETIIIDEKHLKKIILRHGNGIDFASNGRAVGVHYIGSFNDGKVFESMTYKLFEFVTGRGEVITGWDRGVPTMSLGEIAKIYIQSDWAYGPRGAPPEIPPNSDLVFQIDLLKIDDLIYHEQVFTNLSSFSNSSTNMTSSVASTATVPVSSYNETSISAAATALSSSNTTTTSTPDSDWILLNNDGLKKKILISGDGLDHPQRGNTVTVDYTGKLVDGTVFDSSLNPGRTPFSFEVGVGQVIKGWDLGVPTMTKGEKALLYIPSALGYGARGAGTVIPPNADLIFEVKLRHYI